MGPIMSFKTRSILLTLFLLLPLSLVAVPPTYELTVDGLACPFCAYGVEKALTRVQGVASVKIDINAGTVTVTMLDDATLSEAKAKQIVRDAGFTLAEFKRLD